MIYQVAVKPYMSVTEAILTSVYPEDHVILCYLGTHVYINIYAILMFVSGFNLK